MNIILTAFEEPLEFAAASCLITQPKYHIRSSKFLLCVYLNWQRVYLYVTVMGTIVYRLFQQLLTFPCSTSRHAITITYKKCDTLMSMTGLYHVVSNITKAKAVMYTLSKLSSRQIYIYIYKKTLEPVKYRN